MKKDSSSNNGTSNTGNSSNKKMKLRIGKSDSTSQIKGGNPNQQTQSNRYRELLDNIYDAVIITDSDASIIEVNKRALEFFKCDVDDIVGMDMTELLPDADASFLNKLRQMPDSRYALVETRCKRLNNSFFPSEIAVKSLGGKGNNLSFFIRNISKRKETERRLRTVNNAVRNALTAIIITDTEGSIQYSNPAGLSMLGIEDKTLANGPRIQDFFSEKDKTEEFIAELAASREWSGELTVKKNDDDEMYVEVVATPNVDEKEIVSGYVFSILDITQQVAAQQAREMNERNSATIATLGAACHHLSQPATVLVANSEIMASLPQAKADDDIADFIIQNKEAAEELREKLRELNDITLFRTEKYLKSEKGNNDISNTILDISNPG